MNDQPVISLGSRHLRDWYNHPYHFCLMMTGEMDAPAPSSSQLFNDLLMLCFQAEHTVLNAAFHFIDTSSRRTKDWTEGKKEADKLHKIPVLMSDYHKAAAMVESIKENKTIQQLHTESKTDSAPLAKNASEIWPESDGIDRIELRENVPIVVPGKTSVILKAVDKLYNSDPISHAVWRAKWNQSAVLAALLGDCEQAGLLLVEKCPPYCTLYGTFSREVFEDASNSLLQSCKSIQHHLSNEEDMRALKHAFIEDSWKSPFTCDSNKIGGSESWKNTA